MGDSETFIAPSAPVTFISPSNPGENNLTASPKDSQPVLAPKLNYIVPEWSSTLNPGSYFEVLRNGTHIDTIKFPTKDYLVCGRLPICDIELEHSSISRYHVIIQSNGEGNTFLFDLGSAHGTRVNKELIESKNFIKLKSGDQIRFGESSRIYIFFEPELSQPQNFLNSTTSEVYKESSDPDSSEYSGNKEDKEAYYFSDPKKALFTFMDNIGLDLNYEVEEEGQNHCRTFNVRVRVPCGEILVESEQALFGLGSASKRREAERLAALDACIKLDEIGILRGDNGREARALKKKMKRLLGEKGESDDDSYYDRAGEAEKARRLNKKVSKTSKVETFESLSIRQKGLESQIANLNSQFQNLDDNSKESSIPTEELDEYIIALKTEETKKSKLRIETELKMLNKEYKKINKLIEITAPPQSYIPKKPLQTIESLTSSNKDILLIPAKKDKEIKFESSPTIKLPTQVENDIAAIASEEIESSPKQSQTKEVTKGSKDTQDSQATNVIEEDIEAWVPPQNQSGDGITHLNAKFGY